MKTPLSSLLILIACALPVSAADKDKKAAPKTEAAATAQTTAKEEALKDVSVDEAEKLLKQRKEVVVLDVRTPEEFQAGHIAGAKNVDALGDEFDEKLEELDRNKSYVLHCAAGGRSARVMEKMKGLNFKSVHHMNGGMRAWQDAGKPVEK